MRDFAIRLTIGAVLCFAFLSGATAQEKRPGFDVAERLIESCWAPVRENLHSGVTDKMRDAMDDALACLEKTALDRFETLFEPNFRTREELERRFEDLRFPLLSFYWEIGSKNKGCSPACGTIHTVTFLSPYARILEALIGEIEITRASYFSLRDSAPK